MAIKVRFKQALRTLAVLPGLLAASGSWANCGGMVIHAHRGEPSSPENSLSSVKGVIDGAWDGAEIDMQQLNNGRWVLHHDDRTGRTTTIAGQPVANLSEAAWRETRLKQRNGDISREAPPFLSDVTEALRPYPGKVLNAEIKLMNASCDAIHGLMGQMRRELPEGNWFLTAINRNHLACARRIDPNGYFGVIVLDPHTLAEQSRFGRRFASGVETPRLDRQWLERVQQEVGDPVGVHIDASLLEANPTLLINARKLGIPVFTYSLNSDREHVRILKAQMERNRMLPSGAIIDGQADTFCRQLGLQPAPQEKNNGPVPQGGT